MSFFKSSTPRHSRLGASMLAVALVSLVGCAVTGATAGAQEDLPQVKSAKAIIKTNKGEIELQLDGEKAPRTVANFVRYAKDGFYNGTIFHRVIPGFMIQGGGMDRDLKEKPTREPIRNESDNGLSNKPYTIAMARTNNPHSATSQFFINVGDNSRLDAGKLPGGWGYAVFGKMTKGQEVVDQIAQVPTRPRGIQHENVPVEPIVIESVEIVEEE